MTDETIATSAPATDGSVDSAAAGILKKMESATAPAPKTPEIPQRTEPPVSQAADSEPDDVADEMPIDDLNDADIGPDEVDAGDTPTIEAPAGYNAEEKEWFKTLDPARQESILRQYKGTQTAEARRQNEHKATLQRLQAEAEAATQARSFHENALREYANPLKADFQREFADVINGQTDEIRMSQEDPARYVKFQAYQEKFRRIDAEANYLSQWQQHEEQLQVSNFRQAENERLVELMPALKNPETFQKFDAELSDYLLQSGFKQENIVRATADQLATAHKAMLWDRAVAAKKAAQAQALKQQPSAPRVLKPSNGMDGHGSQEREISALRNKARRTGSTEDAASVILARMNAQREARR